MGVGGERGQANTAPWEHLEELSFSAMASLLQGPSRSRPHFPPHGLATEKRLVYLYSRTRLRVSFRKRQVDLETTATLSLTFHPTGPDRPPSGRAGAATGAYPRSGAPNFVASPNSLAEACNGWARLFIH